jgi:hypothetical protein
VNHAPLRILALATLVLAGTSAFAESYTAHIYGVPAGFTKMEVYGAGDNGMMSGLVSGPSLPQAGYLTSTGFRNLHPAGWFNSQILDSWGSTYHCGSGTPGVSVPPHALFWLGGGSAVDMHPAGVEYAQSKALGGGGQLQAGFVEGDIACAQCGFNVTAHAASWSRTAMSFKRLHCTTHDDTYAYATDGVRFVGEGFNRNDHSLNAILWNSVTSFGTNIRPSGSVESSARAISGNQQGGFYKGPATGNHPHAVLWTGTAASAVDLNPNSTFITSGVTAIRNGLQVGSASPISAPSKYQAIAWHGSAATWINLHSRLPSPFTLWHSHAEGIDNLGNVTGYVVSPGGNDIRPVIWIRS